MYAPFQFVHIPDNELRDRMRSGKDDGACQSPVSMDGDGDAACWLERRLLVASPPAKHFAAMPLLSRERTKINSGEGACQYYHKDRHCSPYAKLPSEPPDLVLVLLRDAVRPATTFHSPTGNTRFWSIHRLTKLRLQAPSSAVGRLIARPNVLPLIRTGGLMCSTHAIREGV